MENTRPRPARIAYVDPQGLAGKILPELEERFKNVNMNWSVHLQSSRISAAPQVIFQPVDRSVPSHQVIGFSELPFVQILLIDASKADYRTLLRPLAHDWRRQMLHSREPAGYVVVHYAPRGTSGRHSGWSKIINDFPEHAVQLYLNSEQDSNMMWLNFLEQLRTEIINAFEARIELYEGEIRRLQETKEVVGWNFGALFTAKDGLASCLEQMGLFNEAFNIYTELEKASESAIFADKRIGLEEAPLLTDRKGTLDAALTQQLSRFEYTRYLACRKIILLLCVAQTSNVTSIAAITRAKAVRQGIKSLQMLLHYLPANSRIRYDWQLKFSRALGELGAQEPTLLAELALLERDAIQGLAQTYGLNVPGIFNDIALDPPESTSLENEKLSPVENVSVELPVENEEDLISVFLELTEQAIARFKQGGNHRSTVRLMVQMISVNYALERYQTCFDMIENRLPDAKSAGSALHCRILEIHAKCASMIDRGDRVLHLSWELLSSCSNAPALTGWCVENIAKYGKNISGEKPLDKWFEISISPYLRGDGGEYYLNVDLRPKRKTLMSLVDHGDITALVESDLGPSKRQVKFSCAEFSSTTCRFKAHQFVQGRIKLTSLNLFIKKQKLTMVINDVHVVMKPLSNCLHAKIRPMRKFTTKKRWLELKVYAPVEREISSATASIKGQNLEILDAQIVDKELKTPFTEASVTFPVLYNPEKPVVRIIVTLDCHGSGRYEFSNELDFGLQVLVQMQDLFRRQNTIFSHFFVEPMKTGSPVSLCGASLSECESVGQSASTEHIAFDKSPVSYVFRMKSDQKLSKNKLCLIHRPLVDEIRQIIWGAIEPRINADAIGKVYSAIIEDFVRLLPLDAVAYATQGRPSVDLAAVDTTLSEVFEGLDPSHESWVRNIVREILRAPVSEQKSFEDITLELEVDVPEPEADIIFYITLNTTKQEHYLVGQPVPSVLKIDLIYRNGPSLDAGKFEYFINNTDGWYFAGRTQGYFTQSFSESFTLIPHRPGLLLLPEVSIKIPENIPTEIVTEYSAQRVFVVPEVNKLAVSF